MDATESKSLPENAYRPLAAGESYSPMVPASSTMVESTTRSVGWGIFLCVIFTVASAYSGLKVGQVMDAAIPISILAIGLARVYARRSTVLENVIMTGIGGTSGAMVAGAIFTLPALYILQLDPHPLQTIFICLAGGCLGLLFLIPLRRYFVREMHGQLPYPEATAITEVLVTGEKGGSQARLLLQATAIAGVYDFFVTTFHVWHEFVDFQFMPQMQNLAEQGPGRPELRRHRLHPRPRLRDGSALVDDSVRRRCAVELGPRAADLDDRPVLSRRDLPRHAGDRRDGRQPDLPRLRALHRRRRDRDCRHLRHHQVAPDRGRLLRDRGARVSHGEVAGQERTDRDLSRRRSSSAWCSRRWGRGSSSTASAAP